MMVKRVFRVVQAVLAVFALAVVAGGEVSAQGRPGGGGGGGGSCTPAASRVAFGVLVQSGNNQLFTANPDGTCVVQMTSGSDRARVVHAWTEDNHILVENQAGTLALLYVPNNADPASLTTVHSWPSPSGFDAQSLSAHRDGGGSVLAATQQLVAGTESGNAVAYPVNGGTKIELTHYVSTYVPGGSGTEYTVTQVGWLDNSADGSEIRLWYHLQTIEYLDGNPVGGSAAHRMLSLQTGGWPAISATSSVDTAVIAGTVGGYPLGDLNHLTFSRDARKAAVRGPFGAYLFVMPVSIDDATHTMTIDTAGGQQAASDSSTRKPGHDLSFSPNGGQLAFNGLTSGKKGATYLSIFVTSATANQTSVEIDGQSTKSAFTPIWGP